MQERVDSLAVNPLESAPRHEMAAAIGRYDRLQKEVESGQLLSRIDKNRRAELAQYSETKKRFFCDYMLHAATFGTYTHRIKSNSEELARIDSYRRAQNQLDFLDHLTENGTPPEVAYDAARIQHSMLELQELMPEIASREMRTRAAAALEKVRDLSQDTALQAECSNAIAAIENERTPLGDPTLVKGEEGVALKPSDAHEPSGSRASGDNGFDSFQ
jgi:multidrug resistance efflux pump